MMWYYDHGGMGWGGWLVTSLTFVLFWGALVTLVVYAVRSFRSGNDGNPSEPTTPRADDVLAERFARGEIDEDEFTRRRELLRAGPRS